MKSLSLVIGLVLIGITPSAYSAESPFSFFDLSLLEEPNGPFDPRSELCGSLLSQTRDTVQFSLDWDRVLTRPQTAMSDAKQLIQWFFGHEVDYPFLDEQFSEDENSQKYEYFIWELLDQWVRVYVPHIHKTAPKKYFPSRTLYLDEVEFRKPSKEGVLIFHMGIPKKMQILFAQQRISVFPRYQTGRVFLVPPTHRPEAELLNLATQVFPEDSQTESIVEKLLPQESGVKRVQFGGGFLGDYFETAGSDYFDTSFQALVNAFGSAHTLELRFPCDLNFVSVPPEINEMIGKEDVSFKREPGWQDTNLTWVFRALKPSFRKKFLFGAVAEIFPVLDGYNERPRLDLRTGTVEIDLPIGDQVRNLRVTFAP